MHMVWFIILNLPLQFFEPSFYEANGNSSGHFLKFDDSNLFMGFSTFVAMPHLKEQEFFF